MLGSGLAGLAGVLEVVGPIGQLIPQITPGYGFTAIIVAFLGRLNPLGIIPAALLVALSYVGGDTAQVQAGLPSAAAGRCAGAAAVLPACRRCPSPVTGCAFRDRRHGAGSTRDGRDRGDATAAGRDRRDGGGTVRRAESGVGRHHAGQRLCRLRNRNRHRQPWAGGAGGSGRGRCAVGAVRGAGAGAGREPGGERPGGDDLRQRPVQPAGRALRGAHGQGRCRICTCRSCPIFPCWERCCSAIMRWFMFRSPRPRWWPGRWAAPARGWCCARWARTRNRPTRWATTCCWFAPRATCCSAG